MNKDRKELGERIRWVREEMRVSQEDLGKLFGCAQKTISNIELGKVPLGADELPRLARILEKDISYFFPSQVEIVDISPDVAGIAYHINHLGHPLRERIVETVRSLLGMADVIEEEIREEAED